MQRLVGPERTAQLAARMGIATDLVSPTPGLTLTLGTVPVSLLEMTQAYSVFAAAGSLRPATTILEIRDRNNRLIYDYAADGPLASEPLTAGEAYLTNWILEGNTDPEKNLLWGQPARLTDTEGQRRPAGFKTGTTDNFRDVSGFGYVPGSLVTGVWMGNNNQEPLSSELGRGLFSADGPLLLWQDFMQQALNTPSAWNNEEPVPNRNFTVPNSIRFHDVCRFTGSKAVPACGRTVSMPFLLDTEPIDSDMLARGCLDLVGYERQFDHPEEWAEADAVWVNRVVRGQWGAIGNPDDPDETNPNARYLIAPLRGETGWQHSFCLPPADAIPSPSAP
jgi:membrane peptidoglycan carboxypeptidase